MKISEFTSAAVLLLIGALLIIVVAGTAYRWGKYDQFRAIADCSVALAHQEVCLIPCKDDVDCMAKNGTTDH